MRLNIKDNSIRKKRGQSFFEGKDRNQFDKLNQTTDDSNEIINQSSMRMKSNRSNSSINKNKKDFVKKGY